MMSIFPCSWNPKQPLTQSWRAEAIPQRCFLCWHFNEKYWGQKETKQTTVWTIKIEISSLNHQTNRTPSLSLSLGTPPHHVQNCSHISLHTVLLGQTNPSTTAEADLLDHACMPYVHLLWWPCHHLGPGWSTWRCHFPFGLFPFMSS